MTTSNRAQDSLAASCWEICGYFKAKKVDPDTREVIERLTAVVRDLGKGASASAIRRAVVTLSGPA
jgi:hypothetical protein